VCAKSAARASQKSSIAKKRSETELSQSAVLIFAFESHFSFTQSQKVHALFGALSLQWTTRRMRNLSECNISFRNTHAHTHTHTHRLPYVSPFFWGLSFGQKNGYKNPSAFSS